MDRIGIIEVGSTVTKSYIASSSGIETVALTGIEFKKNYRAQSRLHLDDMQALTRCAKQLLTRVSVVRVFGTSIFRDADDSDIRAVEASLSSLGDVQFEVVTAEGEALLTAEGAVRDLDFDGNIGVMVGGGGSTEVAVFRSGSLLGMANSRLGVGDVNLEFPDLTEDLASSAVDDVVEWVSRRLAVHALEADVLVLAGGDFPLLYSNAGYPLEPNPYSKDPEKRYLLRVVGKRERDEALFHQLRLSSFRHLTPDAPSWWDGTRAMCCVVSAVANQLSCEQLVPTRVSMIYGVASRLLEER